MNIKMAVARNVNGRVGNWQRGGEHLAIYFEPAKEIS